MSDYEIEKTYKVYENDCGHHIEVSPSPDFPGNVCIRTTAGSAEYFGAIHIDLPQLGAELLGRAILLAVEDAKALNQRGAG